MKGVVLAGGLGSRLLPLTKVTNKHLLPVYNKPMIYYPIQTLVNAGVTEIMLVTGGNSAGDFLKLLGNGREFGLKHLSYTYQQGEGGIADALRLAQDFAEASKICVVLGDNIIERSIARAARAFADQPTGAKLILKEVPDAQRFGVAEFEGAPGRSPIRRIIEKPANPPSAFAVTGMYFYDHDVFSMCNALTPSDRGELEITDVNNYYLNRGDMTCETLEGWWTDAGTIPSLYRATRLVAEGGANHPDPHA